MTISHRAPVQVLLLSTLLLILGGCSCGFNCNSNGGGNSGGATRLTLGFSDSLPDTLRQVVLEVDSITFRRAGAADVVVNNFTIPAQNLTNAPTFRIDLLDYRGTAQLLVIENLAIDPGTYTEVALRILDGGINQSFVQEDTGLLREIIVAEGVLSLPGMQLAAGTQRFTIEFGLAQALHRQPSGRYLLSANGVRVQNNATAASLSGRVDTTLFDTVAPCDAKTDPLAGNRVYLYRGIGLAASNLADVFRSSSIPAPPATAIAPFAVAPLLRDNAGTWRYAFGFLPAGDYSLAFSCDTATDDAVNFDDLPIPLPTNQLYEVRLTAGQAAECNLAPGASC